ncbi:GGDEF domain-containing protein [Frateuria aurantia]
MPVALSLIGLISAAGFSLILMVMRDGRTYGSWAASLWLSSLSVTLVLLYPMVRPPYVLLLGHVGLAVSETLLIVGVLRYCGKALARCWLIAPILVYLVLQVTVMLCGGGSLPRLMLYGCSVILWDLWMAALLRRDRRFTAGYGHRIAVYVVYGHALLHLGQLLLVLPIGRLVTTPLDMQHVYLFSIATLLAKCFALLAMVVERLIDQLRVAALTDGLTGLWNRTAVLDQGRSLQLSCRSRAQPLGLIFCDIDHFKDVNDRWGHHVGDQVLRWFCERLLKTSSPSSACCGRYGGEEFVCLVAEGGLERCRQLADSLRASMARSPLLIGGVALDVTVSMGISVDDGSESFAQLLNRADAALYLSKRSGRDQVSYTS